MFPKKKKKKKILKKKIFFGAKSREMFQNRFEDVGVNKFRAKKYTKKRSILGPDREECFATALQTSGFKSLGPKTIHTKVEKDGKKKKISLSPKREGELKKKKKKKN